MKINLLPLGFVVLALPSLICSAAPLGTAFTYQGRLNDGGNPATGIYDLRFTTYDADAGGNVVGGPVSVAPTAVSNGLFTVTLDFGAAAFMGDARWLEISVRTNGSPDPHTTLVPRQPFTPTPYALHAVNAANLMNFANAPLDIKVNGLRGLRLEDNGDSTFDDGAVPDGAPNLIGGSPHNFVGAGIVGATIAGGGATNYNFVNYINAVLSDFGVVGGGLGNSIAAGSRWATIAGGRQNAIKQPDCALWSETDSVFGSLTFDNADSSYMCCGCHACRPVVRGPSCAQTTSSDLLST